MDRDLRSLRLCGRVEGGGGEGGVVGGGLASLAFRDLIPAGLTVNDTVWSGFILSLNGR